MFLFPGFQILLDVPLDLPGRGLDEFRVPDGKALDLFEMVMSLEEEYAMEFPAEDLENLKTVGDVITYLQSKGIEG